MLIQGTQPTALSNGRKRHSETVMLQATFFWNPFCASSRKFKRPKPDVNLYLLPGLKFFSGGLLSGLVFAQWITTCTRPKPTNQDQWKSDRGKFINKIPPWKFGPAPFTSENEVFCQLRRQQLSDNFNGVKAFVYTQTWSIRPFFPPTQAHKTTQAKVPTMCHDPKPLDQEKNTSIPI